VEFPQKNASSKNIRVDDSRVTRLGDFSPIGRLLTLGSILKITEVAQNFRAVFSTVPGYVFIVKKMWLG
jgi:hypothetical protein